MKCLLYFLTAVLLLPVCVFGQLESSGYQRTNFLELGLGHSQLKENNLHSKVFSGLGYRFAFQSIWEYKNISILDISIGNAHLKTNLEEDVNSSLSAAVNTQINYLFRIFANDRWKYNVGPGFFVSYNISYFPDWDESHLYWANYFSVPLHQRISFETSAGNRIIGSLSLPVFHFISRPDKVRDYKMDDLSFFGILKTFHSQPQYRLSTQSFDIHGTMEYQFHRKRKVMPYLNYSFSLYRIATNYSESKQIIQHRIGLKWTL